MDCRRTFVGLVSACLIAAAGCGSKDSGTPTSSTGPATQSTAKPEEVVRTFLEAIRTGNDAAASLMLTELARTETQKHELVVAPPGSDTARFEVGSVEYVVKDELAHVDSTWTDVGDDGKPHTDEIIWALRLDAQGWRIAGMATKIFPNEPPLLLDFEKPEEMMQQQQMAEAEIQRRAQGGQAPHNRAASPERNRDKPWLSRAKLLRKGDRCRQRPRRRNSRRRKCLHKPVQSQLPASQPGTQKAAKPSNGNVLRQ